jgi:hypothetical protein
VHYYCKNQWITTWGTGERSESTEQRAERCVLAKTRLAFDLESKKGGICSLTLRERLALVTDNRGHDVRAMQQGKSKAMIVVNVRQPTGGGPRRETAESGSREA